MEGNIWSDQPKGIYNLLSSEKVLHTGSFTSRYFNCLKLTTNTLESVVEYVQS